MIAVVGPTASGKTWLGVQLAKHLDGEIISADSMQIYKGMKIATAMPDESEKEGIPHHLMNFVDIGTEYSVAQYVQDAKQAAGLITGRGKVPIIVGGTGLYVDSFINNITFTEQTDDIEVKEMLQKRLDTDGAETLYNELCTIDAETAAEVHMNNTKRLLRALEVYYSTGRTMSEQKRLSRQNEPYDALYIGLKCADRELLYKRINDRVDKMMAMGLQKEAREVLSQNPGKTAGMAIGYKELAGYFNGTATLEEATENLKRETRRYAKRQLTWFMRNEHINWINTDEVETPEKILKIALEIAEKKGYRTK